METFRKVVLVKCVLSESALTKNLVILDIISTHCAHVTSNVGANLHAGLFMKETRWITEKYDNMGCRVFKRGMQN